MEFQETPADLKDRRCPDGRKPILIAIVNYRKVYVKSAPSFVRSRLPDNHFSLGPGGDKSKQAAM